MTYLDHQRALYQISNHLGIRNGDLRNAIIWGNHSPSMHVDFSHVEKVDGSKLEIKLEEVDHLVPKVQKRGGEILQKRGMSSALSAAFAICEHVNKWIIGTAEGEIISMGVFPPEQNTFGIPSDICFSVPVKCSQGDWHLSSNFEV